MVRRRSGHIVAISSVQGRIAIPQRSACKLFLLINPSVSICLARTVDSLSVRFGQMQHLNMPPRPTSTVFEPSLSTAGSAWAWSVLGTSGPTCRSTPSQETAPSTEVRPPEVFHFIVFKHDVSLSSLSRQFWTRIRRKAVTPQTWPGRFSRLSVKRTTMSFWQDLCPRWPFTCAHCGPLSSSNSWLLALARNQNEKRSDSCNSRTAKGQNQLLQVERARKIECLFFARICSPLNYRFLKRRKS